KHPLLDFGRSAAAGPSLDLLECWSGQADQLGADARPVPRRVPSAAAAAGTGGQHGAGGRDDDARAAGAWPVHSPCGAGAVRNDSGDPDLRLSGSLADPSAMVCDDARPVLPRRRQIVVRSSIMALARAAAR